MYIFVSLAERENICAFIVERFRKTLLYASLFGHFLSKLIAVRCFFTKKIKCFLIFNFIQLL